MNETASVLAIDMGSTWCKAAYVDAAGTIIAEGRVYTRGGPPFGHAAPDLERSWAAVVESVRQANETLANLGGERAPAAIGISCRKAPGIWLDKNDEPIAPPRSAVESAGRQAIEDSYASETWDGLGPFAYGYGVDLIGNTRWLRRHFPHLWERVHKAGTLHTWLVHQLTGEWTTSPTAGPGQFSWPDAVVELTGLPAAAFPRVAESYRPVSTLTAGAARELGLPLETGVVPGTHDGAAANLGAGAMHVGDACLTLGTNGVLRVVTGDPLERQFGYPVVEGRWAMVRDIVGIAPRLDQIVAAVDGLGLPVSPERHMRLTAEAEAVPPGAFGLRLPVWSVDLHSQRDRADREEIAATHAPGVVYRAALEGIALAFRGLVEVAIQAGASPQRYVATGGATVNRLLMRIMSGVVAAPIHTTLHEAGVRGAAILAAMGAGWFPSLDAAVGRMVPQGEAISATPDEMAAYAGIVSSVDLPSGVAPGDRVRGGSTGTDAG